MKMDAKISWEDSQHLWAGGYEAIEAEKERKKENKDLTTDSQRELLWLSRSLSEALCETPEVFRNMLHLNMIWECLLPLVVKNMMS